MQGLIYRPNGKEQSLLTTSRHDVYMQEFPQCTPLLVAGEAEQSVWPRVENLSWTRVESSVKGDQQQRQVPIVVRQILSSFQTKRVWSIPETKETWLVPSPLFDHSLAGFDFCNFPVSRPLSAVRSFFPLLLREAWMQVADGSDISRLGGTLFVSLPFLFLLPGGQIGGLKSNWWLAGGASRVALSDNCK